MDKYQRLRKLGEGSSGTVWQARDLHTNDLVAIKVLKRPFHSWEECMEFPEFKCQRKLVSHPNVLKLQEVHRESKQLFFVFDYMEKGSLYEEIRHRQERKLLPLSEDQIRTWTCQLLSGLRHVHQSRYIHMDIKPENLLLGLDNQIKIADFGLAMEMEWNPRKESLGYIATRWYRAPELLLRSTDYGPASDIWAVGIIMTELFNLLPIFRENSEADQISRMCEILGEPTSATWAEGVELLKERRKNASSVVQPPAFRSVVPGASLDAIDLMRWMLSWDPRKRPTAAEALDHPFFKCKKYKFRRNSCKRLAAPRQYQQQKAVLC